MGVWEFGDVKSSDEFPQRSLFKEGKCSKGNFNKSNEPAVCVDSDLRRQRRESKRKGRRKKTKDIQ